MEQMASMHQAIQSPRLLLTHTHQDIFQEDQLDPIQVNP